MMKLSVPSWSSSPHRPQFDKAGSAPSSASSLSIRPTGSAEADGDQTIVASAAAAATRSALRRGMSGPDKSSSFWLDMRSPSLIQNGDVDNNGSNLIFELQRYCQHPCAR